jgi:ribonuclease G
LRLKQQNPRRKHRRARPRRPAAPRGRGRRNPRNERKQPTITDLLKEGQEILVQIAKEPIAKKGARITSHIALPGRFLVYMPTVEHLGVSRKIDSDSERARLRKTNPENSR